MCFVGSLPPYNAGACCNNNYSLQMPSAALLLRHLSMGIDLFVPKVEEIRANMSKDYIGLFS